MANTPDIKLIGSHRVSNYVRKTNVYNFGTASRVRLREEICMPRDRIARPITLEKRMCIKIFSWQKRYGIFSDEYSEEEKVRRATRSIYTIPYFLTYSDCDAITLNRIYN